MRDYYVKYLTFCIVFFMFFLTWQLYGGIVVYDCDGSKLQLRKSDIGDMHRKKTENVINEINSNKCLPKLWEDLINNFDKSDKYPINIHLSCEENFDCGEGDVTSTKITIPKYYSNWQSDCGCEESTILHEMLHALAQVSDTKKDHKKIRGCEVKCTANIARCKRYPPPGEACDCPK